MLLYLIRLSNEAMLCSAVAGTISCIDLSMQQFLQNKSICSINAGDQVVIHDIAEKLSIPHFTHKCLDMRLSSNASTVKLPIHRG